MPVGDIPSSQSDHRNEPIEQTMEVLPNGSRRLAAQLSTSATFEQLWKVLTNYNNLSSFIPNLASSEILSQEGKTFRIKQIGAQDFFGLKFSAEVILELIEDLDNGLLKFSLVKGDFRKFEGSWRVSRSSNRKKSNSLVYELIVQGFFGMPVSIIEKRLRKDLKTNLIAVEQEALKSKTI